MKHPEPLTASIIDSFPSLDEKALDNLLQNEIAANPAKIIVLDDDPTGVQTVHGISVYTDWTKDSIRSGFDEPGKLFYILTNSRGFTTEQTRAEHVAIASTLKQVSLETGKPFILMSRSDSTMRGHYPLETDTLRQTLEEDGGPRFDGEILCFFFKEGGRFTIGDVHYVQYDGALTPAGATEFAKDKTFGYASSDLRDYVEEKTDGSVKADDVLSIPLSSLRAMDFDAIEKTLLSMENYSRLVVNAVDYSDVKVFCIALYRALARGKRFLFRTAAALVKVAGGISDKPLLTRDDLVAPENRNGGVILVGSHVNKTTRQLEALRDSGMDIAFEEFNQHLVLEDGGLEREAARVTRAVDDHVRNGRTAAVYTRREKFDLDTSDQDAQLAVSVRISDAVTSVIGNLTVRPSFIIGKGGITSSDVGTKALRVKRALVMGQILPGIPVWQTGPESKFPGLPYVIFPGNVGGDDALATIVRNLMHP